MSANGLTITNEKSWTVRRDIHNHGYTNHLKIIDERENEQARSMILAYISQRLLQNREIRTGGEIIQAL